MHSPLLHTIQGRPNWILEIQLKSRTSTMICLFCFSFFRECFHGSKQRRRKFRIILCWCKRTVGTLLAFKVVEKQTSLNILVPSYYSCERYTPYQLYFTLWKRLILVCFWINCKKIHSQWFAPLKLWTWWLKCLIIWFLNHLWHYQLKKKV